MDVILIIAVIAGLIVKSQGKKGNDKEKEKMGNAIACVSLMILIVLFIVDCNAAIPK